MHNLKVMGLALVAVFGLSAMAAAAASAAEFHSEAKNTILAGGQTTTHEPTIEEGTFICKNASFPGSSAGTEVGPSSFITHTVAVTPSYSNCATVILSETHETVVNTNSCTYTFSATTATSGTMQIGCPTGKEIEIETKGLEGLCTVTVPPQAPMSGIGYRNEGTGMSRSVLISFNITTLKYTQHGTFCPGNNFASEKTFTNGKYVGTTNETGSSVGNPVGIWVE